MPKKVYTCILELCILYSIYTGEKVKEKLHGQFLVDLFDFLLLLSRVIHLSTSLCLFILKQRLRTFLSLKGICTDQTTAKSSFLIYLCGL